MFVELNKIRSESSIGNKKCFDRLRDISDTMENITKHSDIFSRNYIMYHSHNYHHGNLFQKNSMAKCDDIEQYGNYGNQRHVPDERVNKKARV